MQRLIAVALLIVATSCLHAQTSAYQDSDGNTSIYIVNAKANLTYNVSDTKFTVGYLHEPSGARREKVADLQPKLDKTEVDIFKAQKVVSDAHDKSDQDAEAVAKAKLSLLEDQKSNYQSEIDRAKEKHRCMRCEYGVNFSGKPSADLATQIFKNGNSPASVGGGGSFGWHGVGVKDIFDANPKDVLTDAWVLINFTYTKSTFDTIPASATTAITQHFNGFTFLPVYNALLNIPHFNLLTGFGAGVNRTNNVSDLTKVSVTTSSAQSGLVNVVQQKDAYQGTYTTGIGVPIYSDFVFIPKFANWLGIDAFERAQILATNRSAEGGVGIFVAKPKAPAAVLGGISVGWKDGDRTIAMVAGWSF